MYLVVEIDDKYSTTFFIFKGPKQRLNSIIKKFKWFDNNIQKYNNDPWTLDSLTKYEEKLLDYIFKLKEKYNKYLKVYLESIGLSLFELDPHNTIYLKYDLDDLILTINKQEEK